MDEEGKKRQKEMNDEKKETTRDGQGKKEKKRKKHRGRWKRQTKEKTTEGDGRGKENYRRWTRKTKLREVDEKKKNNQTQTNLNEYVTLGMVLASTVTSLSHV